MHDASKELINRYDCYNSSSKDAYFSLIDTFSAVGSVGKLGILVGRFALDFHLQFEDLS